MINMKKTLFVIATILPIASTAMCMEPQQKPAAVKRYTLTEMFGIRSPDNYDIAWISKLAHNEPRPTPKSVIQFLKPEIFSEPVNEKGDTLLHMAIRNHDFEATAFWLEVYAQAMIPFDNLVNAEEQTPNMLSEALLRSETATHNLVAQGRIWCLLNPSIALTRNHCS